MGTWGTGVLEDDFARDVYDRYTDARAKGQSDADALRQLLSEFQSDESDPDQGPVFWLAVARAQWDVDAVTPEVLARVQDIVAGGLGLGPWEEAGARDLARRKKALSRFAEQIQTPRRRKKRAAPPGPTPVPFALGECLAIELEDGRFAAAIVTRINVTETTSSSILSVLDYHESASPEPHVFANPKWVVVTESPSVTIVKYCCYGDGFKRHGKRYRAVSRIDVSDVPPPLTVRIGNWGNVWQDLSEEFAKKAPFRMPIADRPSER